MTPKEEQRSGYAGAEGTQGLVPSASGSSQCSDLQFHHMVFLLQLLTSLQIRP